MADISMGDNHKAQFARWQHVGEHLAQERARLDAELRYVMAQSARLDAEVRAFLQHSYGLDAQHAAVTLDAERGMLVVPDEPAEPATTAEE